MSPRKDLTGKKFWKLSVKNYSHTDSTGKSYWNVLCDCGNRKVVLGASMLSGNTKACGCLATPHGMYGTPIYASWAKMKARCLNSKNEMYKHYGGRGITICERWLCKEKGFKNFLKDMGERPEGTSIERLNNNGNYEPSNCVWATRTEQQNNTSRNRYIEYKGERLTVSQWARKVGIKRATLHLRLKLGWSIEKALTAPIGPQGGK